MRLYETSSLRQVAPPIAPSETGGMALPGRTLESASVLLVVLVVLLLCLVVVLVALSLVVLADDDSYYHYYLPVVALRLRGGRRPHAACMVLFVAGDFPNNVETKCMKGKESAGNVKEDKSNQPY